VTAFCTFAGGLNRPLAACCPNATTGSIEIRMSASTIRGAKSFIEFDLLELLLVEQGVSETTHLPGTLGNHVITRVAILLSG
jgi:hypothetical protein